MRQSRSPASIPVNIHPYASFSGLETMRDAASMESGKNQALTTLTNAYVDMFAQVVREPPARYVSGKLPCPFVKQFTDETFVFAESRAGGIALISNTGHEKIQAYASGSSICATIFSDEMWLASFGQPMSIYDGSLWRLPDSKSLVANPASMVAVVNRRLAVAGMERYRSQVWLSRVDQGDVMPPDENPNDENVLRAGYIDVRNMTDKYEVITGIQAFEWNRLAVFTGSRALVYQIDPDIDKWIIADQTTVTAGCISDRTIVQAGNQLLFCSKSGVHAMSRSQYNNVSITGMNMSQVVETLYRSLVSQVPNPANISAVWDVDTYRYHIFFPISDRAAYRLTMSLPTGDEPPRWSLGTYLNASCADALDGVILLGTPGGVYRWFEIGQAVVGDVPPVQMNMRTPILWCGQSSDTKEGYSYTLHMTGKGQVTIRVTDELEHPIMEEIVDFDDTDQESRRPEDTLFEQFERKFERRFRGVRFEIESSGTSLVRLSALAISTRK